jgi:Na+-transporting NADH:ubiquinone oxidoreductase subunit NqrD
MVGIINRCIVFGALEATALDSAARMPSKGETVGDGLGDIGMWLIEAVAGIVSRFARSNVWQKAVVSCCEEASADATFGGARSGTTARKQSELIGS